MEIRVHPASSLHPSHEIIPAVIEGRVEIAPVISGYLTDVPLEIGPLDLPFMTENVAQHRKAVDQLRPFFAEMLAKKGRRPLAPGARLPARARGHLPSTTKSSRGKSRSCPSGAPCPGPPGIPPTRLPVRQSCPAVGPRLNFPLDGCFIRGVPRGGTSGGPGVAARGCPRCLWGEESPARKGLAAVFPRERCCSCFRRTL